jgi:hypothetical protein
MQGETMKNFMKPAIFYDAEPGGNGAGDTKDDKPVTMTQSQLDLLFADRA